MKYSNTILASLPLAAGLALLTACGGGGSSTPNQSPTVSSNSPSSIDERSQASLSVSAIDSDGSIASYQWVQQSGPEIDATFTSEQLSFSVPEVTEDTAISFQVTVTDNQGAKASTTVELSIIDINRAPSVSDSRVEIEFESATVFSLAGTDPDGDSVTFLVTQQPSSGMLEVIDEQTQQYRYTPNSLNTEDDQLFFEVTDGDLTSSANITLDMVDTSAAVVTQFTPADESERVGLATNLAITFDDMMSAATFANPDTGCSGGLQVSFDDFVSCEVIASVTPETTGQSFEIRFAEALQANKDYQVKVTSTARNFHGTGANEMIVATFTTEANDLRITEVSTSYYSDDNRWLEIYNGTAEPINLLNYSLRTEGIDLNDYSVVGVTDFALPAKMLEAGEFIILQGRTGNGYWQSYSEESQQLVLLGTTEDNIRPSWFASGFVELLTADKSQTIDFIRFGTSDQAPVSDGHWDINVTAIISEQVLAKSLVRDLDHTDSNSPADWRLASFITPAGNNDIFCSEDADEDGIPDCAEVEGSTFAGLPLYDWGARAGVKDIFVEVDYMQSDDAGVTPHQTSLQMVVDSFAANGYAVHFDVGNRFHPEEGISHDDFDLGGGNQVEFFLKTTFDSSQSAPSVLDHKVKNFDMRRRPIFHYLLMAYTQQDDGSGGSSGLAEISGNDLIVSLGNWGLSVETETDSNITINFQAGTIMHELGHNLNLLHGGDDGINYKPNYLSVMNYMYQLIGLPTIGNREGDRYYFYNYRDDLNCSLEGNLLVNGYLDSPSNFLIDYSTGEGGMINETSVTENTGLGRSGSTSVDYNCNGVMDETLLNQDINRDSDTSGNLQDADDWGRIDLQFAKQWAGSVSRNDLSSAETERPASDILSNDRQPVAEEFAPKAAFFNTIKKQILNE